MPDTHYESILAKQLAMNRQTWAALQKHGVTAESKLRLDFSYNAASREAADRLCALLQEQTDYEVKVESSGSFLRRKWRVEGENSGDGSFSRDFRSVGHVDGHCWQRALLRF